MTLDQWIQLGVAIGTLAVAVVAIWGDWMRHLFGIGPRLRLILHDPEGELITTGWRGGKPATYRYYHLRVSNSHKWAQATNVRIVLTSLAKSSRAGQMAEQPLSGPLQLEWRFSQFHPQFSVVGPDDTCDLAHVVQDGGLDLATIVRPKNLELVLRGQGEMIMEVKAIADNAESKPLHLGISWDGLWSDDPLEMQSHLVVKEMPHPKR
jgi:hypothetical protein